MLEPTEVFDTYWRFAAARQAIYLARLAGAAGPWSEDQILRDFRFTNVYRAADRVSQFLIQNVIYAADAPTDSDSVVFRVLLYKIFNRISTWRRLEYALGSIEWRTYDYAHYARVLDEAANDGPIYSAAYLMPPPRLGERGKHRNHLRLLEHMMRDGIARTVASPGTLASVYERLVSYPTIGRFLGLQYTIDLNYTPLMVGSENEFVVAGPGACDGIRKCFGPRSAGIEAEIIEHIVDRQDEYFGRLGLEFGGLFGRPLHLIDCQNLFCEVDKYSRVAHPNATGISGRSRIKQRFRPSPDPLIAVFPPSWELQGVNSVPDAPPLPPRT
ncbi:MAG TPA: nucleotide kinase domain-containing protein [Solirubrobacteraceae bacterium]|nr:nucleotide kinase domain-containing protein [Solirubrobacteraceae bacterium]